KIIDRCSYGWSEFVAHRVCSSRSEVERFYHRLGGYLALFYVTKARDMHFENMIAAGEFPVPVDLETLFDNVVSVEKDDPAINAYQLSVMQVMLLPQRMYGSGTFEGVDLSGFGARRGQLFAGAKTSFWENQGTDEMRLAHGEMASIETAQNRPQLGDK